MSLNDFVVLEKLGEGSFASVYKARRLIDQQIYALKKINLKALGPRQKNNALNEIRLLACMKSQYIIGYCESFFQEKLDLLCIAMQYANGGDLLKRIQQHKKHRKLFPETQIWKILLHLLYGLSELHSRNILHRDLKSENVFINNETFKIGDMNVSKIIKNGLAVTQTGTPYYASPEVWNDQPYNQKSDIWSLGCILYEVASLRPPFEASNMDKLFDCINKMPTPKIPRNYSRQLQTIIQTCLQKNPQHRPTVKDLLTNPTVKIYENLLIQQKPQCEQKNLKQPLLKTIYMPVFKKQLNEKLPQSNYKNDKSREIYKNLLSKEKYKNKENTKTNKSTEKIQQTQLQIKESKSKNNLEDLLKKESQIYVYKSEVFTEKKPPFTNVQNICKDRSRSRSKEKTKQKPRLSDQTNHRKRLHSCQIFKIPKDNSSKKNINIINHTNINKTNSRDNLISRVETILQSQKDHLQLENVSFLKKKQSQTGKVTKEGQNELYLTQQGNKRIKGTILQQQLKPKRLIFQDDFSKNTVQKRMSDQQAKKQGEVCDNQLNLNISSISVQKQHKQIQEVSKQFYLENNLSIISQKNHSYYRFKPEAETKQNLPIIHCQKNLRNSKISHKQTGQNLEQQNQTQILVDQSNNKTINITIDVNQNYQKGFKNQYVKLDSQKKLNIILGVEKLKSVRHNFLFRFKVIMFGQLKNQQILYQIRQKKQQIKLQQNNEKSRQFIINNPTLNLDQNICQIPQKPKNQQKYKRNRSKSLPKTERPKLKHIENNQTIEQKIRKKQICLQSKNEDKPARQVMKQKQLNFLLAQKQKINEKVKQMTSKAVYLEQQQHHKHPVLTDLSLKKRIMPIRKIEEQVICNSMLMKAAKQPEQKRKKIFQNRNTVHELSYKLDRLNLQKKMKRYFNI